MSAEHRSEFETLLNEFFTETCPPELVQQIEDSGTNSAPAQELWAAITEMELPRIGIEESHGGAGGGPEELVTALRAHGHAAAPSPLAASHVALWALAKTEPSIAVTNDQLAVFAYPDPRNSTTTTMAGTVHGVAWGRHADLIVLPSPDSNGAELLLIAAENARVVEGTDLAGMPLDSLHFDAAQVERTPWPGAPEALTHRAMLAQAALMSGALEAVTALTIEYVKTREQFGRPLGKFQSVQQHIVQLQQMSTMSALAVDRAAQQAAAGNTFAAVLAKALVNENALLAVRAAHQAHGAMGMTREYRLQLFTRRLNAWVGQAGSRGELTPLIAESAHRAGFANVLSTN